ncbi:hypothetical protein K469DRAFT_656669 [Zopfia rhizophila CBS 207.26]|uniref:Celp0028 effector like protein n=1 Tax=Zopfia rhizophila CBS 207.26 TaxID=1314779 RepID=A0A6A6EI76_9PEZI|nr:hypothetical protein K469DRAFT_656669 [Zopfia rhizophila CBS 207.26]
MLAPTILSLLLNSGLASAAAVSRGASRPRDNATPLGPDQALYFYNGTVEVRNKTDIPVYDPTAGIPAPTNGSVHYNTSSSAPLSKRGSETVILPNADLDFLGWDVPMSRVVYASTADVTVTSTEGYSISDSITVSQNADLTLVKDFLSVSMGISYSQSWQSSYSTATTFTVPKGKYGVVVSNAWTHRKSGNVWKGTIGSDGSLDYYQADSFTSKSYEDLAWVDGVITVCVGDTYPLPRCLGEGTMT